MNLEKRKRQIKIAGKIGKVLPILPFWFAQYILISFFWVPIWKSSEAQHWIPVEAIVEHVEVCEFHGGETGYRFEIIYSYQLENKSYLGERLSFYSNYRSGYDNSMDLDAFLFSAEKILVYANPKNLSEAIVVINYTKYAVANFCLWFTATGFLIIFVTPLPLFLVRRRMRLSLFGVAVFVVGIVLLISSEVAYNKVDNIPNEITVTKFYEQSK